LIDRGPGFSLRLGAFARDGFRAKTQSSPRENASGK
jgi:hypothetical protein